MGDRSLDGRDMKNHFQFALVLAGLSLVACGGSKPPAQAPEAKAEPTTEPTKPMETTETKETAAVAPAPATDPAWPGLTGSDLEWAKTCSTAKSSSDAAYCTQVGNKYELTLNDMATAMKAYKMGCDAADPVSCMGMARLTMEGKGVPANVDEGAKVWAKACDMELGRDACYELAQKYEKGETVKKDAKKAKEFYTKACAKNSTTACEKIGKNAKAAPAAKTTTTTTTAKPATKAAPKK